MNRKLLGSGLLLLGSLGVIWQGSDLLALPEPAGVEVILLDPSESLSTELVKMGFSPGKKTKLDGIDRELRVVAAPTHLSKAEVRDVLMARFPDLVFDFAELEWGFQSRK
jgi:hypothetical protein